VRVSNKINLKNKPATIKKTKTFSWDKILRRTLVFLTAVFFVVLIYFIVLNTKPSSAPIKKIKIVANFTHLSRPDLQGIINPYLKNGFYYCNTFGLKRKLLELPWVYAVTIERIWPDTFIISFVEQTPVAKWNERALFNSAGVLFSPPRVTFPTGLPILSGPEGGDQEIFQQYREMQHLLEPLKLKIEQLALSPQHYWIVRLNNGTSLYLGETANLSQLRMLVGLYSRIMANHPTAPIAIDMRYSNGLAVKWQAVN